MYDVIVIGAGPAGLAAAAYTIRHRQRTLVIAPDLGGKATHWVDLPWLPKRELLAGDETVGRLRQYVLGSSEPARYFDAVQSIFLHGKAFQVHTVEGGAFPARAVIVATGVEPRELGVPGERRLSGYGVSYSAVSHAPYFAGLRVVVVGDGPRALHAVAELRAVAEQVVHVIPKAERYIPDLYADARIDRRAGYRVSEIIGDKSVTGIVVRAPDGSVEHLPTDGVFVELGLVARTDFLGPLAERTDSGHIIVDNRCATSCLGLFAAGDVTNIPNAEQILIALGEGTKAGINAASYVFETH